jgi:hypothetical protein
MGCDKDDIDSFFSEKDRTNRWLAEAKGKNEATFTTICVETLAVIKYYELRNDRVLVLCPKKLRDNWTVYTQNDRCHGTESLSCSDVFSYSLWRKLLCELVRKTNQLGG